MQLWEFSPSVLAVDLDQTGNKKLLFLIGRALPEVRLANNDCESSVARVLSLSRLNRSRSERLDTGQVIQVPRLSDGKCPVRILLGLVHSYSTGLADSHDNDTRLF